MLKSILVCGEHQELEKWRQWILGNPGMDIAGEYARPEDAWKEVSLINPDCAFLDIDLPGMTGLELAKRLIDECPEIEIILVGENGESAAAAFDIGVMDYLIRPLQAERLTKTVDRLKRRKNVPVEARNPRVSIRTLGEFAILVEGNPIRWSRAKSRELFAYLLDRKGEAVDGSTICEELWPECDSATALNNLQTAVASLRKNLSAANRNNIRIESSDDNYLLLLGPVDWDQPEFEKNYAGYLTNGSSEFGEKAARLYSGDYLGNQDWGWAELTSESLKVKYIDLMSRLCAFYIETGRYKEAQERILMLMEKQPLNEELQMIFLESAFRMEGVAGLKAQYHKLKDFLRNEFSEEVPDRIQMFYDKTQSQKMN